MTNLHCLFRIVWRLGAGHSWRTQGGDGSLSSKVPGGLAGRTWLYYACRKLLPLPGGCFGLWSACYFSFVIFPLVLCLTLFTSSVFVLFSFFQFVLFQASANLPAEGGHDSFCFFHFILFFPSFSFFSPSICLLCFNFLSDCFLSFIYFIECVCRACRI